MLAAYLGRPEVQYDLTELYLPRRLVLHQKVVDCYTLCPLILLLLHKWLTNQLLDNIHSNLHGQLQY